MIGYFLRTLFVRTYRYLLLTFLSIMVGAFLFGSLVALTRSVGQYFLSEGRTITGGDVVLSSSRPIELGVPIVQQVVADGHTLNQEYGVQAVFKSAANDRTSAASIRAVESGFPLYGTVETSPLPFSLADSSGSLYAEQTFLDTLQVAVGDSVVLGEAAYTVRGVIDREPDGVSSGVSFTPKVIMLASDFERSGVDLSQSRTNYKVRIRENPEKPLSDATLSSLETYARENKIRFDDSTDGPNSYIRGLSSVTGFTGIVLAIALFLVVVNIIANLSYILTKFRKTIALLKTFGATSRQIQIVYGLLLGAIGATAGFLGSLLGVLLANSLLPFFSEYIQSIIPSLALLPIGLFGGGVGCILILAAALPFFQSLRGVLPKQLLAPSGTMSRTDILHSAVFYLPIPLLLAMFLYILSSKLSLVLYSVGGLILTFGVFITLTYGIMEILAKYRHHFSFVISSSISSLVWRGTETLIISASIMTAFTGVFIVSTVEHNIVANLDQSIAATTPALYLTDISQDQLGRVREVSGASFQEYPIIRGRILTVAGRDMTESEDPGITREFSMTYRDTLIPGEVITTGTWHGTKSETKSVSVDRSFAEELGGVSIGDTITVFIQGLTVEARVTSLRESERSNGTPFFYLVFSPDVLRTFPANYFATVEAEDMQIRSIKNTLGSEFPNIIPIETGKIIQTIEDVLGKVILVVQVIGIPSLMLGLMLILVMTSQSLYERKSDVLLLRAFGLRKRDITGLFLVEAATLILVASIVAYAAAHLVAYLLNVFLFDFEDFSLSLTPIAVVVGVLIVVGVFVVAITESITRESLKKLLSEK
jgi:putative ABC transport system permease protein